MTLPLQPPLHPKPTDESTLALDPEARPAAIVDVTCEIPPAPPPQDSPPVDATCDIPAPPAGTIDLVEQPAAEATCDIDYSLAKISSTHAGSKPSGDSTRIGKREETLDRGHAPHAVGDATGDYHANTDALPGNVRSLASPGDATCDLDGDSEGPGRGTSLRASPALTQPAAYTGSTGEAPQKRAGRYVFKKFHAKGGMGEVWLAEDSDIGRPVALKRILKGRENQKLHFLKEAQVTGQLEHPGVIPVHELSVDENGQPYYVMKFIHGQTLKEVIADFHQKKTAAGTSREVQWLRLMNIFLDLCQTIAYAHSRGVIHRDIKPDNVMVGAYGETLVLDWGLAKVISEPETNDAYAAIQLSHDDETLATLAGSVKGTPFFFAPEVAAGQMDEVDQISDVYLLGGTLYNMVTGRTPRSGKKITPLLELAKTEAPAAPRTIDPTIPKPLDAICRKALAMKKADRYQSASALADDVQHYLAGEPISAYQETFVEKSWRWIKRHRTGLSRGAAALFVGALGVTAFLLVRDAELRRAEAQQEAAVLTRQEAARQDVKKFRNLMEEARFYAASADPIADYAPALDASKAEAKATAALAVAEPWGPELAGLPLEEQRPGLKKDLYDLLLEMAQLKSRHAAIEQVKEVQKDLERAAGLQTPTQSFYRLRAAAQHALGLEDQAAQDRKRAQDPQTPTTALDYYLAGEQQRVASAKQEKDDASEGKQAGIKGLLARQETLQKAIASYRQALRLDPNHYWSHFQLATSYSGLGSYPEAVEALGTCVALRPEAPWGYSARGLALSQIEPRAQEAASDLNYALRLDPDFRPARLHRAVFYAKQKKYAEAEKDFEAVLALPLEKRLREAYFARGQMYLDQALFDKALADFQKVVADGLPIRTVHLHLARIYLVKEEPEKALESLTKFLATGKEFDPESPHAYEQRGRELRLLASEFPPSARNRREEAYLLAAAQLQKSVQLGGQTASLFGEIGSTAEKLAELQPRQVKLRKEQAIAAYGKGIDLDPNDAKLHVQRGWAYVELGKNDQAKEDFAAAVAASPDQGEAHTGLGYTEALLKAPSPARRQASLALLYGAGDYLVLHNVACIYGALSKTDPVRAAEYQDLALDQLQRAVDLWKKGGKKGPNEIMLIRGESAFPPALKNRPEFKKLVAEKI